MGRETSAEESTTSAFEEFVRSTGLSLRRVLSARWGSDLGVELTSEALAYAWEHWERVSAMDKPVGYLYRVANSAARRHRRQARPSPLPPEQRGTESDSDHDLGAALNALKPDRRTSVVMVHVYGWSYAQVADALGISPTSVRNHVHRGLVALRRQLEDQR